MKPLLLLCSFFALLSPLAHADDDTSQVQTTAAVTPASAKEKIWRPALIANPKDPIVGVWYASDLDKKTETPETPASPNSPTSPPLTTIAFLPNGRLHFGNNREYYSWEKTRISGIYRISHIYRDDPAYTFVEIGNGKLRFVGGHPEAAQGQEALEATVFDADEIEGILDLLKSGHTFESLKKSKLLYYNEGVFAKVRPPNSPKAAGLFHKGRPVEVVVRSGTSHPDVVSDPLIGIWKSGTENRTIGILPNGSITGTGYPSKWSSTDIPHIYKVQITHDAYRLIHFDNPQSLTALKGKTARLSEAKVDAIIELWKNHSNSVDPSFESIAGDEKDFVLEKFQRRIPAPNKDAAATPPPAPEFLHQVWILGNSQYSFTFLPNKKVIGWYFQEPALWETTGVPGVYKVREGEPTRESASYRLLRLDSPQQLSVFQASLFEGTAHGVLGLLKLGYSFEDLSKISGFGVGTFTSITSGKK